MWEGQNRKEIEDSDKNKWMQNNRGRVKGLRYIHGERGYTVTYTNHCVINIEITIKLKIMLTKESNWAMQGRVGGTQGHW